MNRTRTRQSLIILIAAVLYASHATIAIAAPLAVSRIYWTDLDGQSIGSSLLDGTDRRTLVSSSQQIFGLDVDPIAGFMYWINYNQRTIQRSDLNGTNITTLLRLPPETHTGLYLNLRVDRISQRIYWAQDGFPSDGYIGRANLNGSDVQTFITGLRHPDDIAVDPLHNQIFWTQQSGQKAWKASLDGIGRTTVSQTPFGADATGMTLDSGLQQVFWSEPNNYRIARSGYNGESEISLIEFVNERPFGLALDAQYIYWTDSDGGRIRRADRNGSNITTLVTGLAFPRNVVVAIVPEPATIGLITIYVLAAASLYRGKRT
jgi:Low-density lipoprotein receptor repeat class B